MSEDVDHHLSFETFIDRALITEVLHPVKSGKEATVYCCKAHPKTGVEYLAAKLYRPSERRSFKNDAVYQEGRWRRENRLTRAYRTKTAFGREVQFAAWVQHEWETIRALYRAGVAVPKPFAAGDDAILMEFFGDRGVPASPLHQVRLSEEDAQAVVDRLLADVERMLSRNVIHGDLSAFNVLYRKPHVRIIDFPQAVDPRFNSSAFMLLTRDIENVAAYGARSGVRVAAVRLAAELWERFMEAQL